MVVAPANQQGFQPKQKFVVTNKDTGAPPASTRD
jgi:hypothetical protein